MPLPTIETPIYELKLPSSNKKIKYRPFLVKEEKILILALESKNQDDITNAGATYTDLPAVVDGKIITTAHYKDMGPWMRATLDFFNEKKK